MKTEIKSAKALARLLFLFLLTSALTLPAVAQYPVTVISDQLSSNDPISIGDLLRNQSVDGWHFYSISNGGGGDFTNAVFLTFLPNTNLEIYASANSNLTNLDSSALLAAHHSSGHGGTETIVVSNVVPRSTWYVGIHADGAASYGLLALYANLAFYFAEPYGGDLHLRGFPAPAPIPDGTGSALYFCVAPSTIVANRGLVVTNIIRSRSASDLVGTLTHGLDSITLYDHSLILTNDRGIGFYTFPVDGLAGEDAAGQWRLTISDTVSGGSSTNFTFDMTVFSAYEPVRFAIARNGNSTTLTWRGRTDSPYSVEWSPTLRQPTWTQFPGYIESTNGDFSFVDTDPEPIRFYRAKIGYFP